MTPYLKQWLLASALLPTALCAQVAVDRSKYPDYSDKVNPDPSLMHVKRSGTRATTTRPDHVNNADTKYFPPVIYQAGGSCGSASRICYMFSHELNSFRDLDGKNAKNYYPSHFVWLLTNGNSGKDAFVQFVGVPSAETYGGQTYSKIFGSQDTSSDCFGWMTGYKKWYEAMFNRMLKPVHFTENLGTEEGREALKNWLWNHNGDTDFHSGGIAGIGCASKGLENTTIGKTPTNDELGVTGKYYLKKWGTTTDHAMTIVGYDDRIEFDINGNGIYGEASADERGAWILVNSWGKEWGNDGFVYVPYAYAGATFNANGNFTGNWWTPEVYRVRKNYRPLRTIKVNMDYNRRSELYLMAGVSSDVNATSPEKSQAFDHFKYAGDGNYGNTDPAPEVPMLGRWADNKLHSEPMEFGYDLTDLSAEFDQNEDLKYFFIIKTKDSAIGEGHIYNASIIDYANDPEGLEIPLNAQTVNVLSQGDQTVLSVVVPGRGIKAPLNVNIANNRLSWSAPKLSNYTLTGYKVVKNGTTLATLDKGTTHYDLPTDATGNYGVMAVYGDKESSLITASVPVPSLDYNQCIKMEHNGLTLPNVFTSKYDKATIEFWIRPQSLANWNQSAGPGWGTFMFHANANGTFTAGWDTSNRLNATGALTAGRWTHISLVVDGNKMTAYVNGSQKGTVTSKSYSGIGGFGDLVFSSNGTQNDQHAFYDEIRIWKKARTAAEIKADYKQQYATGLLPSQLIAYYRGDLIEQDGNRLLRDLTSNGHHGTFANANFSLNSGYAQTLKYATTTQVAIEQPSVPITTGQSVTLQATGSTNIQSLRWTAEGADVKDLVCTAPTLTFNQAGEQQVKVVATDVTGAETEATITLNVTAATAPSAEFKSSKTNVPTGDRVTFMPTQMKDGYRYHWTLQGASTTSSDQPCVTVSYAESGSYQVQLTVTNAEGQKATTTQTVNVTPVAPQAAFDIEPAVVMKGDEVFLTDQSLYGAEHSRWTLVSPQTAMQGEGARISFRPSVPGIYDVTLRASNTAGSSETTQSHALVVCNADSKSGLSFMPAGSARVNLTSVPLTTGQDIFTIEYWMKPNSLPTVCNGIGESTSTFQLQTVSTGQMRLYINGKYAKSANGYVVPNEWHHYAVTYYRGYVCFYRDGIQISRSSVNGTFPSLSSFSLGSTDAPMCGTIDEFRVWNGFAYNEYDLKPMHDNSIAPLSAEDVKSAETAGLKVYYQFNQNGGNVEDLTSNHNTGLRVGFGPDGDAWGDSKGVFALNFDGSATDVTAEHLSNTRAPFETTGKEFSEAYSGRFMTLKAWQLENINAEKYNTGAHIDTQRDKCFTITTGNDGFESLLENHKVYQTITLPAGAYVFTANYGNYEGQADNCYLVAAEGTTLPDTKALDTSSIAYKAMASKGEVSQNRLFFILSEPTTLSLGLLANMSGQQCLSIQSFTLTHYQLSPMDGLTSGINTAPIDTPASLNAAPAIYDLSGRRVSIPGKGIYIIGTKKVIR